VKRPMETSEVKPSNATAGARRPSLRALREAVSAGPPYDAVLLASLRSDPRAGARALHAACVRRQERDRSERDRLDAMLAFERTAWDHGFARVAGVDEAGRGPLAGPIVAAAVVLADVAPGRTVPTELAGLDDSKRLSPAQRETLFARLEAGGHGIGVAVVEAAAIDGRGIQWANYAAMARAVAAIRPAPDLLLVDGFSIPGCAPPQRRIVKGDRLSLSIAAASIVAKVTRDRIMVELDRIYPAYGFGRHKGYATQDHMAAVEQWGPCPAHRKTFAPIGRPLETGELF